MAFSGSINTRTCVELSPALELTFSTPGIFQETSSITATASCRSSRSVDVSVTDPPDPLVIIEDIVLLVEISSCISVKSFVSSVH